MILSINLITYQSETEWVSESLAFFHRTILNEISEAKDEDIHVIVSGGNSPIPLYRRFFELNLPWEKFHFWLADERCVPYAHSDRSETNIKSAIGSLVLNRANFHSIPEGEPKAIAEFMNEIIKKIPSFHFTILGIGEDGHIASIFPGENSNKQLEPNDMIPIYNSPKPPKKRVSLSIGCINRSNHILFLTKGNGKKNILEEVKKGTELPANLVFGKKSSQIYFCTE
ncbi:6-phosphogluconolactonase [Leptospira biflexa]|nr:6-phosphogluconolactonase [Leptospira biflexa]TGM45434.1 6-phosphogluconolactonase [Leptospira biflexa]